jgi:membrane protein implicated in regulation of membrane protease activity
VLLLVAIVLFVVLPTPWNGIALLAFLIFGAGEVSYWWRKVRHRRIESGAETLIGARAKVVSACRPEGQVSLDGALWNARCEDGADAGEPVVVRAREGLLLIVEPVV